MNLLDLARSALAGAQSGQTPLAAATRAQVAELRELVPKVCAQVGEDDVDLALQLALADPEAALSAYRYLASLAPAPAPVTVTTDDRRPCSACRNQTDSGRCLAAYRGELPDVHRTYSPVPDVLRRCECYAARGES